RWFVRPPPQESRRVAEAIALQVIVRHLADALDSQRFPGEILATVPARGGAGHALIARPLRPLPPGTRIRRPFAQRRALADQTIALRRGARGSDAHVMELAPVALQTG